MALGPLEAVLIQTYAFSIVHPDGATLGSGSAEVLVSLASVVVAACHYRPVPTDQIVENLLSTRALANIPKP